jgi:dipeptidyl aminopeptidase/acylaminoacyl peptidase
VAAQALAACPEVCAEVSSELAAYQEISQVRGRIAVQPGGMKIAFAAERPLGQGLATIWMLDGYRYSPVAMRIADGWSPTFSPDGREIAYLSQTDGKPQVWVYALKTGRSRQLTQIAAGLRPPSPGTENRDLDAFNRIAWDPSGRVIAVARARDREGLPEARVPDWMQSSQTAALVVPVSAAERWSRAAEVAIAKNVEGRIVTGGNAEVSEILCIDAKSGQITRRLTDVDSLYAPSWSPRKTRKLYALKRHYDAGDVFTSVATTENLGATWQPLSTHTGPTQEAVSVSPGGGWVSYLTSESTGRSHAMKPRQLRIVDADGHDEPVVIDVPVRAAEWSSPSRLLVVGRDGLDTVLIYVDAHSRVPYEDYRRPASLSAVTVDRRSGNAFWVESDPTTPLRIVRWNGKEPMVIFEQKFLAQTTVPVTFVPLRWIASDGARMAALLAAPETDGPRPRTVVIAYPGDAEWSFDINPIHGINLLLNRGYAVLRVNARAPHSWFYYFGAGSLGSSGQGAEGVETVHEDIDRALELTQRSGVADGTRACGLGHSNGGGVIMQFIAGSSRLRCAIIAAPAFGSWWTDSLLADPAYAAELMGGPTLWQDPNLYSAVDPAARLDKVTAKTLFVVGGDDWIFPIDVVALFNGLRAAGKKPDLLVYPKQGHVLGGAALTDFWQRELKFLDANLH